ncbi:Acetylesterase [Vanrija pseudolonga]|uniref:Acetylesterase n=1 Tax=Vanrija pseudolonga TaxID=143232 RepID=A0AAF1BLE7_9TREE|nr:Acetylesterase [Vanrija pseudolonga]
MPDRRYAPLGGGAKTPRTRLIALFGAVFIGTLVLLTHPPLGAPLVSPWSKASPDTVASRADAARDAFVAFARSFPQIDTSHPRVPEKEDEDAATTTTGTEARRAAPTKAVIARDVEDEDEDDEGQEGEGEEEDEDDEAAEEGSSSSILPPPRTRRLNTPRTRPVPDNYYVARLRDGRTEFDWSSTRRLFVFGDSFSSIGSNYRQRGVGSGHPGHLDGKIGLKWSDYLYSTFKDPRETGYWNFARDGATIDLQLVPPRLEESGALDNQVDEFQALFTPMPGPAAVDWDSATSLFVVLLGINDVREMARREFSPPALHRTSSALPRALMTRAGKLYRSGARHFLFFTLASLADAPKYSLASGIGHNVSSLLRTATAEYNRALDPALEAFEAEFPEANAMLFDWEGLQAIVGRMPEVFGLTDCSRFEMSVAGRPMDAGRQGLCYQDPSHPTWSIAHILAQSVNGFLHRHSRSFWLGDKTDTAWVAK